MFLTKVENDINFFRGDLAVIKADGRLKTVSDADYESVVSNEKYAEIVDGNVVFTDNNAVSLSLVEDDFNLCKTEMLERIDHFLHEAQQKLARSEWSDMKTRMNNFRSALNSFDPSTVTYPVTTNFSRYWFDNQSVEPLPLCYFPH